jgi:hypothetical protein
MSKSAKKGFTLRNRLHKLRNRFRYFSFIFEKSVIGCICFILANDYTIILMKAEG